MIVSLPSAVLAAITIFLLANQAHAISASTLDKKADDSISQDTIRLAGLADFFEKLNNKVEPAVRASDKKKSSSATRRRPRTIMENSFGLSREQNRQIQQALTDLKYSPGSVDGLPGNKTQTAIRQYQKDNSLIVTGIPSLELLKHMQSLIDAQKQMRLVRDERWLKANPESGVIMPSIPEIFHGIWDSSLESCNREFSETRIYIKPTEIGYWESIGRVSEIKKVGENSILVTMSMFGEGRHWESTNKYQIIEIGNRLEVSHDSGGIFNRIRCQDTTGQLVTTEDGGDTTRSNSSIDNSESPTRQETSSPQTLTGIKIGDLEEITKYLKEHFPETYSAILDNSLVDRGTKSAQLQIAYVIAQFVSTPDVGATLLQRVELDAAEFLRIATTTSSSDLVTAGFNFTGDIGVRMAEEAVISTAAALATDVLFRLKPMQKIDSRLERPLRALIESSLIEMYDLQRALKDPSVIVGKVFDRYNEILEIAESSRDLASTQDRGLLATALSVETSAKLVTEYPGQRSDRVAADVLRDMRKFIPDIVGKDDAVVVERIFELGYDAIRAEFSGERGKALALISDIRERGRVSGNINPFSALLRPVDWLTAAANWGKDSPERAVQILIASTVLATVAEGTIETASLTKLDLKRFETAYKASFSAICADPHTQESGLPCPFVAKGKCEGEGCTTRGPMRAREDVALVAFPGSDMIITRVGTGDYVFAEYGEVWLAPCKARVTTKTEIPLPHAGKFFWRLLYVGEGFSEYWSPNKTLQTEDWSMDTISTSANGWENDPCNGKTHREWLLMTAADGQRGWTDAPNAFDGSDRLSGDDLSGAPDWTRTLEKKPSQPVVAIYNTVLESAVISQDASSTVTITGEVVDDSYGNRVGIVTIKSSQKRWELFYAHDSFQLKGAKDFHIGDLVEVVYKPEEADYDGVVVSLEVKKPHPKPNTITVDGRAVSYWPSSKGKGLAEFQFDIKGYRNTYTLDCLNRRFLWTRNVQISTGEVTGSSNGAEWKALNPQSTTSNAVYQAICPQLLAQVAERVAGNAPIGADIDNAPITDWMRLRYADACAGSDIRAPGIPCPYREGATCIGEGCFKEGIAEVKKPVALFAEPGSKQIVYTAKAGEYLVFDTSVTYSVPCRVLVLNSIISELKSGKAVYRLSYAGEATYRYLVDGRIVASAGGDSIITLIQCTQKDEQWMRLRTKEGIVGWAIEEYEVLGTSSHGPLTSTPPEWAIRAIKGTGTRDPSQKSVQKITEKSTILNASRRAIVREILDAFDDDLKKIHLVADNADYAVLAWAAYNDHEALALAKQRGWTPFKSIVNENLLVGDTVAMLFVSDEGGQVIAYRGTDLGEIGDLVTDVPGSIDMTPLTTKQVSGAREIAREHRNTIFVGHSLGGRLAQVAHLETGNRAVGFNSAPLGGYELTRFPTSSRDLSKDLLRFRSPKDLITATNPNDHITVANNVSNNAHSIADLAKAMQQVRLARDEGWIAAYADSVEQVPTEKKAQVSELPEYQTRKNINKAEKLIIGTWKKNRWLTTYNEDGSVHVLIPNDWREGLSSEKRGKWWIEGDMLHYRTEQIMNHNNHIPSGRKAGVWYDAHWPPGSFLTSTILNIDENTMETKYKGSTSKKGAKMKIMTGGAINHYVRIE